jgi:hypothetical protein
MQGIPEVHIRRCWALTRRARAAKCSDVPKQSRPPTHCLTPPLAARSRWTRCSWRATRGSWGCSGCTALRRWRGCRRRTCAWWAWAASARGPRRRWLAAAWGSSRWWTWTRCASPTSTARCVQCEAATQREPHQALLAHTLETVGGLGPLPRLRAGVQHVWVRVGGAGACALEAQGCRLGLAHRGDGLRTLEVVSGRHGRSHGIHVQATLMSRGPRHVHDVASPPRRQNRHPRTTAGRRWAGAG